MIDLDGFDPVDGLTMALASAPVPADQTTAGNPSTGSRRIAALGPVAVGVWEMTAGGMRDIEVDELFVVLAGEAAVTLHSGQDERTIRLAPGTLCRLEAGMRTTWVVEERLRKLYVTGPFDEEAQP